MADAIMEVRARTEKYIAPIVRFVRQPVDDVLATKRAGIYVSKDVDFAYIAAPYSRGDEHVKKASEFIESLPSKVRTGQMPQDVADRFKRQYEAWLNGQELPLDGVAIKGWSVISPAQQAMLIERRILTVEMLAQANDEGLRSIGMGAMALRNMAKNWLTQAQDKGPLVIQMASLEQENAVLKGSIDTLMRQVSALQEVTKMQPVQMPMRQTETITEADVIPDMEPVTRPPSRKR
jgi:hypothetical protein